MKYKGLGWLLFFMTVLFGGRLWQSDLRGDSMNYAAISNNVLTGENPLLLTLNGEAYMNKPPLFFWLNALFIKLFGANPFGAKFATLLAVVAMAYLLYRITYEFFEDCEIAVITPFLVFTTYIVYKNTHMLKLEAVLSAFLLASVLFFMFYLKEQRRIHIILFGFFCGCAIFVKGPLGLMPVLGALVFPLVSKEYRSLRYYGDVAISVVIAVGMVSWWFVYVSLHTDFFNNFFLSQLLDRVGNNSINVTGTVYNKRPVWAYLRYMVVYGGFFIPLVIYGLYKLREDNEYTDALKFFLLLAFLNFVIIHFITTREHRYLYQVYLFGWVAGAYGLKQIIKSGYISFIKYAGLVFAIFIALYPKPLHWNSYSPLVDAKKLSDKSNIPIVAQEKYLNDISDKAAMSYYAPNYITERPESGKWIEVVHKKKSLNDGLELSKARRVKTYLVEK